MSLPGTAKRSTVRFASSDTTLLCVLGCNRIEPEGKLGIGRLNISDFRSSDLAGGKFESEQLRVVEFHGVSPSDLVRLSNYRSLYARQGNDGVFRLH